METSKPTFSLQKTLTDPVFVSLLASNVLLIALFYTDNTKASTIIITYYFQSVLIGFFHVIRMGSLKNFDPSNFKVNGKPLQNTSKAKWGSVIFFILHFGMFHFMYLIFLAVMMSDIPGRVDFLLLLGTLVAIIIGLIVETREAIHYDRAKPPLMATLFFSPYLRVVPMHIFIVLGFTNFKIETFIYFLLLKTATDVLGYFIFSRRLKQVPTPFGQGF